MEENKETIQEEEQQKDEKQKFDPYAPHKIKWWGWLLLIGLIVGTVYIVRTKDDAGNAPEPIAAEWNEAEVQRCEGGVFGTFYHITYNSSKDLQKGIDATLNQVDASLSPFNEKSVITAINNNKCMKADSMFTDVFLLSKEVSAETNGAFDITVAPLVNLWGFGFKNNEEVDESKVAELRQFVGIDMVSLNNGEIVKEKPEIMLDCSAIAKGYGVDAVGKYLEKEGIENYMVEIGGEVRVRGVNPKGALWAIGINTPIDDPTGQNDDIQEVINITQQSMATSGNYRNFRVKDGKKYAHTIDPRTGYPVQHSILSSTVIAEDCATADAYATSFMVLGLDGAKKVLGKHSELMAFFIYADKDGNLHEWYSPALAKLIKE